MLGSEITTRTQAHALLTDWLRALCHEKPEDVVNLYEKDGILIGTVAEEIKRGRPAIQEYFDVFMNKDGAVRTGGHHGSADSSRRWSSERNLYLQVDGEQRAQGSPCKVQLRFPS